MTGVHQNTHFYLARSSRSASQIDWALPGITRKPFSIFMRSLRQKHSSRKARLAAVPACLLLAMAVGVAQNQPGAPAPTPSAITGEQIISFLNQTIVWSRQVSAEQQLVNEPSDTLFLNDSRQTSDQVVRLAFEFARAQAQASQAGTSAAGAQSAASQYQRLIDSVNQADQKVKSLEQELAGFRQQLLAATGRKRTTLQALISETEGEVELYQTRRDTLRNMLQFASASSGTGLGKGSLLSQVEELARSVPAANTTKEAEASAAAPNSAATAAATARDRKETPNGMLSLATDLFALHRKMRTLDENLRQTDLLGQSAKDLRAPLVARVKELTQQGDQLAGQPDSQDPAVLAQQRKDLDAITTQFKQVSASLLPLGKQGILLDVYRRTATNWRNAVNSQFQAEWKGLLLRLVGLALILGVLLGVSELWRRATFRYITDTRRRYQFLLVRRIVLWCLVAIIVATAFASELGAITTFAGLLTAGIAVALQNVILSIAGYFFLIGKYGVRVGDRVNINGVTGDVVDIGLVRLQVMEVTGGPAPRPTGRVVAFSNAVVFQAGSGMFKQIPGTNFVWHEVTLTLDAKSNYRDVERRMMEAINKVFAEYRDTMEMQRRSVERSLNSTLGTFAPESRLQLTQSALEVVVRYPLELSNAAEIDNRMTRAILDALEQDPKLRAQVSAGPSIKAEEQPAAEETKSA
jgi:small-conductance mechanosensitive channel